MARSIQKLERGALAGFILLRDLTPDEIRSVVTTYNLFCEVWNEHERDRGKKLLSSTCAGLTVQIIRRSAGAGAPKGLVLTSSFGPFAFGLSVSRWKGWTDGLHGPWQRLPIDCAAVQGGRMYKICAEAPKR